MSPIWLKSIPWSTILSNAPLIVEGAKKLAALARNKPHTDAEADQHEDDLSDPTVLRARIARLEDEQRQSAELIRSLAESQAQMAQAIESVRSRVRLGMRAAIVALVGFIALLLWMLLRAH